MSKEHHLGQIERDQANIEGITERNIAREAEIRRPAKKIEIVNPTITDDKERAEFLSKELKNMVGNTKYIEDLFQDLNTERIDKKIIEIFDQARQMKANLTTMSYSFPMYKADALNELSSVFSQIDIFSKDIGLSDVVKDRTLDDSLKLNFEEHKEALYDTLGGLIDQYSE